MNNNPLLILLLCLLLSSCRNAHRNNAIHDESKWEDKVISNKCFSEEPKFFQGTPVGNSIVDITPMGNFLKYTAINDSQCVFSCGRNYKEISLYTFECHKPRRYPALEYESEGIIILITPAGTNVWSNDIITLYDDSVYHTQAYYIDTNLLRYVEVAPANDKVYFIVRDILGKRSDTVLSNYYRLRPDGDPSLHIEDVSLNYDTLYYTVSCDSGVKRDTLYFLR